MPIMERLPLRRVTLSQALQALAAFPVRSARTVTVPVEDAEGRILAADVSAREDVPAFRRSRVDGYAVIASEVRPATKHQPLRLHLLGEVIMGRAAAADVASGQTVRIPTGGALPSGATGVVMVEDAEVRGDTVTIFDGSDAEEYVTDVASDVRSGERMFSHGAVLSPAALGLIAGAGVAEIRVYKPPLVGVIVTGDELIPPKQALGPGQIRDMNSVVLPAALRAMGFATREYGRVADERAEVEACFRQALQECDAVIISGGSSVGERDYTPAIVAAAGSPGVVVHGIKAKPGRPAVLGLIGDQPVFGLPGNPVSALVVLESLAKPVLLRMFGKTDDAVPLRARLEHDVDVEAELEHRIPVTLSRQSDHVAARPLLGTSSQMHIMGFADGLLVVPLGKGRIAAGSWVDIVPLSRSRTLR